MRFSPRGLFLIVFLGACLLPRLPAAAQSSSPAAPPAAGSPDAPLAGATVRFNNRALFRLFAAGRQNAEDRAELVSLRLEEARREWTEGPLPRVSVEPTGDDVVIRIDDRPLLTVTAADGTGQGEEPRQLARTWASRIENAFAQALRERQPGYLREAAIRAGVIFLAALWLHLVLYLMLRRLSERPGGMIFVLFWIGIAYLISDQFPQSRPINDLLTHGRLRPLFVSLVVALGAGALVWLWKAILRRLLPPISGQLSPEERTVRAYRRRATLGAVARVTGITVIWIVAFVVALTGTGVNLSALLTSAGLIGVAVGLVMQDSMRDLIAGINVLLDDRFGVGDTIRIGEYEGRVENLNLRITQIRDGSGRLVTFQNRNIDVVANLTSRWAQVDFRVTVPDDTDLRAALRLLEETAERLAGEWPERILQSPEMLGVDAFNESGVELRLLLRTTPGDQWAAGRELRLRVKEAFDASGIRIPFPHRTLSFLPAPVGDRANPEEHPQEREVSR